jgi:hypothetical protein
MIGVLPPAVRRRSLRFGSVPASLRLRSTFPFAKPQAEANLSKISSRFYKVRFCVTTLLIFHSSAQ